ncbi:MAG: hypothetical protein IPJ81_01910 [Chitinophagaceae bacterium]|nr:hypothetical protein [Chitinophagaceae bacterium]
MTTFSYDGDVYPMPKGFEGLSMEDWYMKMATIRDRLTKADELDLEPMQDEDGDDLDAAEIVLIKEFGFKNGGHWENFRNWTNQKWSQETGESPTNLEFRMGGIAREKIMGAAIQQQSGAGGLLEPVEGITMDQWAQTNAKIFGGGDMNQLIAALGIDKPKWDRVSAEWNDRMSKDTTFTITTAYGNAFASAGQGAMGAHAQNAVTQGVGGDLSEEPMSYERYTELMVAQQAADQQGKDVNDVFAQFGISVMDFSNISMFWSKKMQQNAEHYWELDNEYRKKYEAKYGIVNDSDDDDDEDSDDDDDDDMKL